MGYKNNNVDYIIDDAYDGLEHEELRKFFTKELIALDNLDGPSSYAIENQIKQLQEDLKKAEKRQEIVTVLQDYDLEVRNLPDADNKGKTICFIGSSSDFSHHFIVPERGQQVECDE